MPEVSLISFLMHHWVLVLLFLIVLSVVVIYEQMFGQGVGLYVSVQEAIQLINREDAVVLDIRDKEVFKKGHIVNAVNIPKTITFYQSICL